MKNDSHAAPPAEPDRPESHPPEAAQVQPAERPWDRPWPAGADQGFAASALGQRLLDLLDEGSAAQRRLADFVLRQPMQVAARGIEDLAAAAGVSPASISRFAREVGLGGYAELRAAVADAVERLSGPVAKLRDRFDEGARGAAGASLATAERHLAALTGPGTAAEVEAAARVVAAARAVYVMGFGLSAHVAAMLTLGLQPYRGQVVNVVQYGGTEVAAGRLVEVGPGDVLIAISFPRYARDAVQLARFARDKGATVITITDAAAAPIARLAERTLTAPAVHPVLSSSLVGGLALAEALVAEVILSDPGNLARAQGLTDAIAKYLVAE